MRMPTSRDEEIVNISKELQEPEEAEERQN